MKEYSKSGYKDLYSKIKFIIIFRILAFSIIILAYILINFKNIAPNNFFVYSCIALAIFLTLIYSAILFYLKKKESPKFLIYFGFVQLFADFIFISAIVLLDNSLNDKFIFLYYLLIPISGFIFLRTGIMIFGIASAIAIGLSADLQYYFDIGHHAYFFNNPDKLLFLTSSNILGVLIFSWLLYHFSGELSALSNKIIEREEFIIKSQNFNRELFNSFSQGIIVLDEYDAVIFLNNAAVQMLNLNSQGREFKSKSGVLHNFHVKITDIFENFPLDALTYSNEPDGSAKGNNTEDNLKRFELRHKNKILGFGLTKLENSGYKIGQYILLFRDITYIKQLELESKINEGLSTAGKLAGWLAHEIRNPLSAINTSIYILSSENMDYKESDYQKLIGIIMSEVQRLDNLVNDFLGFVKVKSKNISGNSNFENFNLFLFVQELISRYNDTAKNYRNGEIDIKIHNSINKNIEVFSEKNRVGQMLANILQNAIQSIQKNTPAGKSKITGIIRFGSKTAEKNGGKKYISIGISDNGEGMDDFTLKNAFKPLFTTKDGGFGLGLSIVHSIAESLGGEIETISRVNKGTLMKINLPILI
ncbi:MAG: two-component system sensor histidine kinase NtrB [bacterium]